MQTHASRILSLTFFYQYMLLLTKVKQFPNLLKIIIIRNKCYSVNCDFPIRYVNGCPESKILLKYPHWQLFIQTSQFYMGIWHKLLKSKHCYFFNITLPWMKIWRWRCSRYLKCEISMSKVFRYTEVIRKKHFMSFPEMPNYVWYLWYSHKLTFPSMAISNNFSAFLFEKQYAIIYQVVISRFFFS